MPTRFLPTGDGHRVTTLELLFDLVFVYAITAVNTSVVHRLSPVGLVHGLVMMSLIWFGWAAYAWLGNQARADEGALRISMYVAMAGFFVVALSIHEAFAGSRGGLRGPVVFVVAYGMIRLAHLLIYWVAAGDDRDLRRTIEKALVTTAVTLGILLAGAVVGSGPRLALWLVAIAIDYVGIFVGAAQGWRVLAPGHFAERHSLVIIIAIGESLVSVATAIAQRPLDWRTLSGALMGVTLAITLWRTYFNAIAVAVEDRLRETSGDERTRMARDVFTYLHLPAVAGIVGMAVGQRAVLDRLGRGSAPLPATAIVALCGGAALYLLTLSSLRWRVRGSPSVPRLVLAAWFAGLALVLPVLQPGPLADVAIVTGTFLLLVTWDAIRYGASTREMRLGD